MDELTKGLDLAGLLTKIAAGGWPSWIAAGVLGIVGLLLYIWWEKRKADLADAETDKKADETIGSTLPENKPPQDAWTDAGDIVDKLREEARRSLESPENRQQQQQAELPKRKYHSLRDPKTGHFLKSPKRGKGKKK